MKFNAKVDRPALIGTVLDPCYRTMSFLAESDRGKCVTAVTAAYNELVLEMNDDSSAPAPSAPPSKRRRVGPAGKDGFNFDIDATAQQIGSATTSELQRYLAITHNEPLDMCALDWWRRHEPSFPVLAQMARRYLAIPASSAVSDDCSAS